MDFWTDIAFTVILKILKSKSKSREFEEQIFKVHGKIEAMFPELQCERNTEVKK